MKDPKCMEMSEEELADLISRVKKADLASEDADIVLNLFEFNSWLQSQILEKNISIHRLRKIFGSSSEKSKKKKKKGSGDNDKDSNDKNKGDDNNNSENDDNSNNEADPATNNSLATTDLDPDDDKQTKKKPKHRSGGRMDQSSYTETDKVFVPLDDDVNPGDLCLNCENGKVGRLKPITVLKITGRSFAKATKYLLERLRCLTCGKYYIAKLPPDVSKNKYDSSFKSYLCLYKYSLGVPSYRLEAHQRYTGVPIQDSTQWDKIKEVATDIAPVYKKLIELAANGELIYSDDTGVRILSLIKENKKDEDKKRKGMFTTGMVCFSNGHKITLFFNGRKHTGENIQALLEYRDPSLPKIIYMCDAIPSNMPKILRMKVIMVNCLVHARRNFFEIKKFFPKECTYILDCFGEIYKNDDISKQLGHNAVERMKFHREYSMPYVRKIYDKITTLLKEKRVEANGSLGGACRYLLNHGLRLTRFMKTPGVPLDNNEAERALKIAIRVRKNSLFYATENGANVGGTLQSIIYTCIEAGKNPVEYLTALQDNKDAVALSPEHWMPWNYERTMKMGTGVIDIMEPINGVSKIEHQTELIASL